MQLPAQNQRENFQLIHILLASYYGWITFLSICCRAAEDVQVVQLTGISKSTLIRKRKRRNI